MYSNNPMFNQPLWNNGPQPGAFYNFPGQPASTVNAGKKIDFGMQRQS